MDTTKRPWRVNEAHIRHCLGCDGYITIAESVGYGPKDENRQICEMNSSDSPAEVLANARLIVQAVNHFDEMVEALGEAVVLIDHLKTYPKCNPRKFFFLRDGSEHGTISKARALLKRAKGE